MKKLLIGVFAFVLSVSFTAVSFAQYPWEKESNKAPAKASAPTSAKTVAPAVPAKARPTGRNVYQRNRAEKAAAAAKGRTYGQTRAVDQTMNKMVEKGYPQR